MARNNTPEFVSVVEGVLNRLVEQKVLPGERYQEFHDMTTSSVQPQYVQQDDFTVALLNSTANNVTLAVGVSKRNPIDQRSPLRGRALAVSRAVRDLVLEQLKAESITVKVATPVATLLVNQVNAHA